MIPHALVLVLRQLRLIVVCRPGWTARPTPYIFGTVQKGAQTVCLLWRPSRSLREMCLLRAIIHPLILSDSDRIICSLMRCVLLFLIRLANSASISMAT